MTAGSPEWETPDKPKPGPQFDVRTRSRFLGIPALLLGLSFVVFAVIGLFRDPFPDAFPDWIGLSFLLLPLALGFWIAVTGLQLLRAPTFGLLKSNLGILSFLAAFSVMARFVGPWWTPSLFVIALAAIATYLGSVRLLAEWLIEPPRPTTREWISRGMMILLSFLLWIDLSSVLNKVEMRNDDFGISVISEFLIGFLLPILVAVGFFHLSVRLLRLNSRPCP
ncbi:hypothetical protein [Haloferula sp. A504]|uniref:hypothetical protein n=1 Tax=Haloferula sp. A504 TaxID=3373601 RepID=UPI0031C58DCD|nr:hypothetical protein [Verrucomicrobiaceae bacterium E54]